MKTKRKEKEKKKKRKESRFCPEWISGPSAHRAKAASYPDVSLDMRAKEGGKETTGETSGRSCFQDGGKSNGGPIYNF